MAHLNRYRIADTYGILTFVSDSNQDPSGPNRDPLLSGEPDPDAVFARCLRVAREAARLTQQQTADAMRGRGYPMRQNTISTIEAGTRQVWLGEAVALAEIVGVSLTDLLTAPAPETDVQEAIAALGGAERNLAEMQAQADIAAEVLVDRRARLEQAAAAAEAARAHLVSLTSSSVRDPRMPGPSKRSPGQGDALGVLAALARQVPARPTKRK